MNELPPKTFIKFISAIEKELKKEFTEREIELYLEKWQESTDDFLLLEDFIIYKLQNGKVDILRTLFNIEVEKLIRIAFDLGMDISAFVPGVRSLKQFLQTNAFYYALDSFEKAMKNIFDNPDIAIGLANSALESIIKEILKRYNENEEEFSKETTYKLTQRLLKKMKLFPDKELPKEIRDIGSALLTIAKKIEELRSNKTEFHGKIADDKILDEPGFAVFIINAVATVGLFLEQYYKLDPNAQTD